MIKADKYTIDNIIDILENGTLDENPRPKYKDGTPAHTLFITQVFEKYNLAEKEFPITTLRPIPVLSGIKEIQWIYQDQSNDLGLLEDKYGIMWWRDWEVGDTNTIGQRYGATIRKYDLMNKLLKGLVNDPFGRRHIISMWQEEDFKSEGLNPCAFQTIFSARKVEDIMYLDMTLVQR
jgi:thymidylate synthase